MQRPNQVLVDQRNDRRQWDYNLYSIYVHYNHYNYVFVTIYLFQGPYKFFLIFFFCPRLLTMMNKAKAFILLFVHPRLPQ